MAIPESTRWRVIRAIIGWDMKTMSEKVGVIPNTLANWERGRSVPNSTNRRVMAEICQEHNISIRSDGYPLLG